MDTLFNNPIKWAERSAGTPMQVALLIVIHAVATALAIFYEGFSNVMMLSFGLIYPAFYLFALHKTLLKLRGAGLIQAEKPTPIGKSLLIMLVASFIGVITGYLISVLLILR